MTVFGRQEVPTDCEPLCYEGTLLGEACKDRLLPFDCNEVRRCLMLGEFLEEPLPTSLIVVNATVYPYHRLHCLLPVMLCTSGFLDRPTPEARGVVQSLAFFPVDTSSEGDETPAETEE